MPFQGVKNPGSPNESPLILPAGAEQQWLFPWVTKPVTIQLNDPSKYEISGMIGGMMSGMIGGMIGGMISGMIGGMIGGMISGMIQVQDPHHFLSVTPTFLKQKQSPIFEHGPDILIHPLIHC